MIKNNHFNSEDQKINFVREIESICKNDKVDYVDAVIHFCEKNDIEIESIASLISGNALLLSRIREEAEELNYLEKTRRLPL